MTNINAESLRLILPEATRQTLVDLEVFKEIGSTNTYLLECQNPPAGMMRVAIAEQQTAGRGQRDKGWFSPPGSGLWMSVAYSFTVPPAHPSALTLAIGATLADEIEMLGIRDIKLKWPNDLIVGGAKLGGILLESCAGGMTVIAGVGINFNLPKDVGRHIEASVAPTDLNRHLLSTPSIGGFAARMIERTLRALQKYESDGIDSFTSAWSRFDALLGHAVVVSRAGHDETGIADGISNDGALMLLTKDGRQRVVSGTVRLIDHEDAVA